MEKTTRRAFLHRMGTAAVVPAMTMIVPSFLRCVPADGEVNDEEIFRRTMEWAGSHGLSEKPLEEVIAAVGKSFLGTPYVAHSLELPGEEQLVVNLHAFDCLTFVESTLAISRCIRTKKDSFGDFRRELQQLRYRNGVIDGYPSRLHYFSEWIRDNEKKGIVKSVSQELGGIAHQKTLNFMSTHRSSYAQLENEAVMRQIEMRESEISQYPLQIVPRNTIREAEQKIKSGDVVALATSMEGIDVSHTGLAVVSEREVQYLHAPLSGGAVRLSRGSLSEYIQHGAESLTGVMVVRPLEPVSSH